MTTYEQDQLDPEEYVYTTPSDDVYFVDDAGNYWQTYEDFVNYGVFFTHDGEYKGSDAYYRYNRGNSYNFNTKKWKNSGLGIEDRGENRKKNNKILKDNVAINHKPNPPPYTRKI